MVNNCLFMKFANSISVISFSSFVRMNLLQFYRNEARWLNLCRPPKGQEIQFRKWRAVIAGLLGLKFHGRGGRRWLNVLTHPDLRAPLSRGGIENFIAPAVGLATNSNFSCW